MYESERSDIIWNLCAKVEFLATNKIKDDQKLDTSNSIPGINIVVHVKLLNACIYK